MPTLLYCDSDGQGLKEILFSGLWFLVGQLERRQFGTEAVGLCTPHLQMVPSHDFGLIRKRLYVSLSLSLSLSLFISFFVFFSESHQFLLF